MLFLATNLEIFLSSLSYILHKERFIHASVNGMKSYISDFVITLLPKVKFEIDGLVQKRRNSSALAMELRLSCNNPPK